MSCFIYLLCTHVQFGPKLWSIMMSPSTHFCTGASFGVLDDAWCTCVWGRHPGPLKKKSCCRQISKFRSALWISHPIQCSNITEGNEWHKFTIGDRARFLTFSLVNNVSLYKNIIFWWKQINNNVIICVFREQSMFQDFPVDEFRQYPESIRSKYYP